MKSRAIAQFAVRIYYTSDIIPSRSDKEHMYNGIKSGRMYLYIPKSKIFSGGHSFWNGQYFQGVK